MPLVPSTKFLIDESVEFRIVLSLRERGFDVKAITEASPSISDVAVLRLSYNQRRILVTNDTDFGTLIFKEGKKAHGVILIRMPRSDTETKSARLNKVLKTKAERLAGFFTVVTEGRTRQRLLPDVLR